MKSRPFRRDKVLDEGTAAADELLNKLFIQAKAQFGAAIKSFWFYDGDLCPACAQRPIGVVKYKGKDALAINAFIYRERGVLIGYFLCETCATHIFKEAQKNPYRQTPIHADIERNLIAAYHKHLASLDA
ncbi:MAG: hypothetical protein Q7U34_03250 [Anaerolineales bacterium]|nr:hypothetical protein [Anaerolineales bacterium]MDP3184625.1 hypothetical protein [Anaerolineales bacterium]